MTDGAVWTHDDELDFDILTVTIGGEIVRQEWWKPADLIAVGRLAALNAAASASDDEAHTT